MKVSWQSSVITLGHLNGAQYYSVPYSRSSLIHSTSNRRTRKGTWSGGGGFMVQHLLETHSPCLLPSYTYLGNKWGGLAVPTVANSNSVTAGSFATPTYSSQESTLSSWGVKGWKRARPGNPVASLFTSVGELAKDGLPRIPFGGKIYQRGGIFRGPIRTLPQRALQAVASFKNLGKEYLNLRFGWEPLVKDLIEMYNLTETIDRRLADLRRNNGRSLKRERVLKDSTTVTTSGGSQNGPFGFLKPTPIIIGGGTSSWQSITTVKERIWFEGRYKYWVPNIGSPEWDRRARAVLFGAYPTPHAVWKLLPWSWLIDWFSTIGDSLSNMSENAVDNLVAQYAHVMRQYEVTTVTTVFTSWGGRSGSPSTYSAGSAVASVRNSSILKTRMVATPYGFGIAFNGLTAYQQSILAALGASRKSFT